MCDFSTTCCCFLLFTLTCLRLLRAREESVYVYVYLCNGVVACCAFKCTAVLETCFMVYSLSCHLIFVDVVVVVVIVLVVDLGIVVHCAYTHLYAITGTKCGFMCALWLCSGKGKQRTYIGISRFLFGLTKTSF